MNHPLFTAAFDEAMRARELFPSNRLMTLAFAEEAGEVVKAAMDVQYGKATMDDFRKELIQTVAMALRLWEEGDATLPSVVATPGVPASPNRSYFEEHLEEIRKRLGLSSNCPVSTIYRRVDHLVGLDNVCVPTERVVPV